MTTPNLPGDPTPVSGAALSGIIANRYRIEREIGEGGMATVYLARDLTRDVDVALKAPKPELVIQLGAARFAREIQISTKLQHPHIVPVLDAGFAAGGVPFYVMPFVDGETLEQRLTRTGALPVDEAITIASEVLDGLVYAHKLGFVHRDVKPSNVLLSNGHAMLADFGIARAVETTDNRKLTDSGFALGTAEYMSPEQAAGESQLDGRSDLYSLGCVLYEMLVGGPPFTAPTARGVMARHFVDPVPSIRTVRDTVPVKLEAAVMTALSKIPVDRFADASAFKAALRDPTLREVTAAIRPPGAMTSRARWIAAGVGVLAVAGAAMFWRSRGPGDDALDINRVMVYPFVVPASVAGANTMGEDVSTIIGNALDGADPLRWIDGWSLLEPDARSDIRVLTHDAARRLARGKRCATFLTGRLVSSGDSVKVFLTLHAVKGDSVLAQGEATGSAKEPWRQGLSAVSAVLPKLIANNVRDLSDEWSHRDPRAVANFLLGESEFRRVHMKDALVHYRKAIGFDSTFAFAALRGAQAATWNDRSDEAASMLTVALAQPLPPRYHEFALGFSEYLANHADSSAKHLRAAIAADPEMTTAWIQLGEMYTHLLPLGGTADSLADEAFRQAQRLDSTTSGVLVHLIETALRRGDTTAVAPMLRQLMAAHPDSGLVDPVVVAADCVRRGAAATDWRSHVAHKPLASLIAAQMLAGGGEQITCARAGFASILAIDTAATEEAQGRRYSALLGLHAVLNATGNTDAAIRAIEAFSARWGAGRSLFLLGAPLFPGMLSRARDVARSDSAQWGVGYVASPYNLRLWELGRLALVERRLDLATSVGAQLRTRAAQTDSSFVKSLSTSMDAFLQLARGDSAAAEKAFTTMLLERKRWDGDNWDEVTTFGAERLALARLLLARHADQQALDVASVFDSRWVLIYVQYLPASLELRAQAATSLGNPALASHYLARLAALKRAGQASGS